MEDQYEIGSSPDNTYVYVRAFQQPFTFQIAQTVVGKLVQLGKKLGVLGCLLDLRGTVSISSNLEKYEFSYKKMKILGLPRIWRFALLKDPDDASPNFIETVMNNAGYNFKLFTDEPEALDWLKGTQPV